VSETDPGLVNGYVEVLNGIHAGVEPLGSELVEYLGKYPIPGIYTTSMHPEAVQHGVRFLGAKELGSHFTDETLDADPAKLDPEGQAVCDYIYNLERPYSWLTIDPHCSPVHGSDALIIGERSEPMLLGLAHVFGLKNIIVLPHYPMFNLLPQIAAIETECTSRPTLLSRPAFWHTKLSEVVELGPDRLEDIAKQTYKELSYYRQIHIERVNFNTGQLHSDKILDSIALLEGQEAQFLDPVTVPTELTKHLGIEGGQTYAGNAWDDKNYSPALPELREDGRPKLAMFGDVVLKLAAPRILHDSTMIFLDFNKHPLPAAA
jgi:hypothetical protein